MGKVVRLDYCQFLFVSQIKSTLTHFAEHTERFSQDAARRYLQSEQIIPPAGTGKCVRTSGPDTERVYGV
jgi:hypothetical protein